jgi:hypothetical protein
MHCHVQIANAAKAGIQTIAEFADRTRSFRLSPPALEKLPQVSVYVSRARNRLDHAFGPDDVRMRRDIDLAIVVWLKASPEGISEEAGRIMELIEPALTGHAGLTGLVIDGLVHCAGSDLRTEEQAQQIAVLTLTYPISIYTPDDNPGLIITV